jgi:GTPase SAR1 family protein
MPLENRTDQTLSLLDEWTKSNDRFIREIQLNLPADEVDIFQSLLKEPRPLDIGIITQYIPGYSVFNPSIVEGNNILVSSKPIIPPEQKIGYVVPIWGPSGSGKSTLIESLHQNPYIKKSSETFHTIAGRPRDPNRLDERHHRKIKLWNNDTPIYGEQTAHYIHVSPEQFTFLKKQIYKDQPYFIETVEDKYGYERGTARPILNQMLLNSTPFIFISLDNTGIAKFRDLLTHEYNDTNRQLYAFSLLPNRPLWQILEEIKKREPKDWITRMADAVHRIIIAPDLADAVVSVQWGNTQNKERTADSVVLHLCRLRPEIVNC